MDKKNYTQPNVEIINIDSLDVITTSGYGDNNAPGKMPDIVPESDPFWY